MHDDSMMSEQAVLALVGRKRFERLLAGKWLSPCYRTKGCEGQPMYQESYVRFRFAEDLRIHPETRLATVTKSYSRTRERADLHANQDETISPYILQRWRAFEWRCRQVFEI